MSAVALARSRELQPGHVRRVDPGSTAAPGEPAASRWRPRLVAAFLLALGVWVVLFVLAGAARAEDPAATAGGDSPLAETAAAEEDPTAVPAASPLPVAEPPASPPDEHPVTTTPGTLSESPSTETSPAAPVSAPSAGPTPVQTPIPVPVPAPVPVLVPAPTPSTSTAQDLSTGI